VHKKTSDVSLVFCFYSAELIPLTRYNLVWNIGFTNHRTPFIDLALKVSLETAGTDFVHWCNVNIRISQTLLDIWVVQGRFEGGIEFGGNILSGALLGAGAPVSQAAKQSLKQGIGSLFKKSIKDTLLRQAGIVGIETGSEVLTGGLQTEERFKLGITDQRFMDGAIDTFGPALVASMIFGGVGEVALRKVSRDVRDTLKNPEANPKGRLFAAKSVYDAIKPASQTVADKWYETAFKAIKQGEAIDLDAPMETDPILDQKIADDDALGRRAAEEAAKPTQYYRIKFMA
jgi:hypothetical protein